VQFTGTSAGAASVSQNGAVTNIRTTNNAILNFSQFNIAAGSTVNFIQPNAMSRELNRINSAAPSMINGAIVSNGAVYMINPAGVIFGNGATVDVNKLVVAGSHMSDSDFLSGVDHFTGVSGLVSNAGSIRAGQGAILIGSQVVNTGSIVAPGGVVAMLSGSDVLVSETGSHVAAKIIPNATPSSSGGSTSLTPKDLSASPLAAGDPYALAIRHSGTISAGDVLIDGGKGNVQVSGAINASHGAMGGNVAITGGNVTLASANINASGANGGGTIQIGGGPAGSGDLAHADSVSADGDTTISADAISYGNGGSLVLFSDGTTTSSAMLSARGGLLGGNGGKIETSGEFAQITRAPDESAPNGVHGEWLLDPLNVDIISGVDGGTASLTGNATVTNGTIVHALTLGNVVVTTNQTGTDSGTLTQEANAPITASITTATTLQLEGTTTVSLHGGITNSGTGALSVFIDTTSNSFSPNVVDTTPITIKGNLKILGGDVNTSVSLSANGVQLGTGTVGVTGVTSDNVTIGAPINAGTGTFSAKTSTAFTATNGAGSITAGGTITISTTGAITLDGAITSSGGAVTLASTGGAVSTSTATPINTGGGSLVITGSGFTDNGPITDGGIATATHSISINTAAGTGAIAINSPITWAGSSAGGAGGSPDPITIEANGNITIATAASIIQSNLNPTAVGTVPVSLYCINSASSVTINGTIDVAGAFISGGGAPLTIASQTDPTAATIQASSASISTVTVSPDAHPISNGAVFIAGGIIATAPNGTVNIGGTVELTDNNNGFITTNGGDVTWSNTGQQILGEPISTSGTAGTVGGNFTATAGTSFVTGQAGSITTGGGDVVIFPTGSEGIQISAPINTGGGNLTLKGQAFTDQGLLTDGAIVQGTKANASALIDMTQNNGTGDINGVTITWQGGAGRTVTILGGGNVAVNNVTATGTTPLPVTVTTTNANDTVSITGPVNITGQFTTAGGIFDVSVGSLTAASLAVGTITQDGNSNSLTTGSTTFSGAVSTTGGITITSAGFTTTGSGTTSTTGGALTATTTGDISIQAPVQTNGGAVNLSSGSFFSNSSTGTITSGGGAISLHGSTGASIGADVNTGGGNFSLTGGSVTTTAEISDGGINDSRPQGLTIASTNGNINVGGPISWAASFSPITFSVPAGSSVNLGSSITANASEPINFAGIPIVLMATSTIAGGSITLGAVTDGTSGSNPELIIQSSGAVSLQAIGTSTVGIGGIQVQANNGVKPTTTLNGDINVTGDAIFNGTVLLPGNVKVTSTSTNQNDHGDLEFNGNIEGPGGLTLSSLFQIRLNGNVGDTSPLAFLDFTAGPNCVVFFSAGPAGSTGIALPGVLQPQPAVEVDIVSGGNLKVNDVSPNTVIGDHFASISAYGPVTINFGKGSAANAANLYAVGENEKFSVHGAFTLNANGGTVQTGDISATGNLSISAATIKFMGRLGQIDATTGETLDTGMDLISGGQISLPGSAVYLIDKGSTGQGDLGTPVFIAQSYSPGTEVGPLSSFLHSSFSVIGGLDPAVMFGQNNLLLDLTPASLSVSVPKFVPPIPFVYEYPIAGAAPIQDLTAGSVPWDFRKAFEPVYPGPVVQQNMKDNGVYTRDPNTEEIVAATGTMVAYNDMPGRPRPHASDYKVVVNRLDTRRVDAYLDECRNVFGSDPAAKRAHMTGEIQSAWDSYVTQNGEQPATGAGFAKYCATTPSAAPARADLEQLHTLRGKLGDVGLSYKEAQVAFQYNLLYGMSANGMREGDLAIAVANAGAPAK
jgi:filamentous hemagglutinin family protein